VCACVRACVRVQARVCVCAHLPRVTGVWCVCMATPTKRLLCVLPDYLPQWLKLVGASLLMFALPPPVLALAPFVSRPLLHRVKAALPGWVKVPGENPASRPCEVDIMRGISARTMAL
jgi:hypothetical protein